MESIAENSSRLKIFDSYFHIGGKFQKNPPNLIQSLKELFPSVKEKIIASRVSTLKWEFTRRWEKARRTYKAFLDQNLGWLKKSFIEQSSIATPVSTPASRSSSPKPSSSKRKSSTSSTLRGRKKKETFSSLSKSRKRSLTQNAIEENSPSFALYVSEKTMKKAKRKSEEELLKLIAEGKSKEILKSYRKFNPKSAVEGLELLVNGRFTKSQYQMMRQKLGQLPPYNEIVKEKEVCYPKNIKFGETEAVVPLQELVDKTAERFWELLKVENADRNFKIIYKYGFDGSGGQAEYKQKFEEENETFLVETEEKIEDNFEDQTTSTKKPNRDDTIFISTLVPIAIEDSSGTKVWQNEVPSSTRFCRPIRISYQKEDKEAILKETNRLEYEIKELKTTTLLFESDNSEPIRFNHQLFLTMIDGKTINIISNTNATSKCYICGAVPSKMNDLTLMNSLMKNVKPDHYRFGISPLHARIKFLEYVLKISYRLTLPDNRKKKGTRLSQREKELVTERKRQVQNEFKKIGLLVDQTKAGFGTSNDGNTSRRFFSDIKSASTISGVDQDIIKRFGTIANVLNCKRKINADYFKNYCQETATQFVEKYSWFQMSVSIHKILFHGADIIQNFLVPIGALSEEAQESRNKDFKTYRKNC